MKWTISKKIYICVAASLSSLIITGCVNNWSTQRLIKTSDWVAHTHKVLERCTSVEGSLKDAESGQRGFVLTGDEKYLAPFKQAQSLLPATLADVQNLTKDNPRQQQRISSLRVSVDAKFAELQETIKLRSGEGLDAALAVVKTDRGKSIMDNIRQSLDAIEQEERDLLARRESEAKMVASAAQLAIQLVSLLSFGICGLLSWFIVQGISKALRKTSNDIRVGAEQVATASHQVASASQSLAQGSTEQAASLEETSASGQEINAMAQKNAANANEAAALMSEVEAKVKLGNQTLEKMITSMNEITSSSQSIANIIKVIDGIAFQTNILALNAAVEAARAGEAGAGFAVVADEVRSLAQRCAEATTGITNMIEQSSVSARQGNEQLGAVNAVINGITASTAKVKLLVDDVCLGAQEQTRGLDLIANALSRMEQVTQSVAADAEESASASEELRSQAESMQSTIQTLDRLVHGGEVKATVRR